MIRLLDIGAANGAPEHWARIADKVDYVGFEPDDRSTAFASGFKSATIERCAIWPDDQLPLHLCRKEECSSFYRPNRAIIDRFSDARRFDVVGQVTVPARPLDDYEADFIKIDIQGGELRALESDSKLSAVFS